MNMKDINPKTEKSIVHKVIKKEPQLHIPIPISQC